MAFNRRQFIGGSAGALAGLSILGCQGDAGREQAARGSARTIVFKNGKILPVDPLFSEFPAMAIRGNEIVAVGSLDVVMAAAGQDAETVDLNGRTVLPGFIEPHMHFALMAGLGHLRDIGPFKIPDFDGVLDALSDIRADTEEGAWVTARQYDPILLEPPRDLTINELDSVVPDRPAFILNASGHIAYVNSLALELAGINRDTPDPAGAEFGRFDDGTPNGILYGPNAHMPVIMLIEDISNRMDTGFVDAGREVGREAAALGITTLCDQATGAVAGPPELEKYRQMFADNKMDTRIRSYVFSSQPGWDQAGVRPGEGDALMRIAGWKIVTDGSNQGFTGRQREPYYTRDTLGIYYVEPSDLQQMAAERGAQGWQLSMHGNGDAAIDSILDAIEHADAEGVDVRALRCRIEHCSILHDDQIQRLRSFGMGPSFLINHVHYWGHVMRDRVFGPEKVELLDRCQSVDEAGLNWTIHTDSPVSPLGSLHKLRVAVARDLWKEPETILAPQERVSVESAIRAITINAAWQCHSEDEIGSLEPGKLADFVVLDQDPRSVEPTAISDIGVSETWMNGRQVFQG